jgi:hypothetical protein
MATQPPSPAASSQLPDAPGGRANAGGERPDAAILCRTTIRRRNRWWPSLWTDALFSDAMGTRNSWLSPSNTLHECHADHWINPRAAMTAGVKNERCQHVDAQSRSNHAGTGRERGCSTRAASPSYGWTRFPSGDEQVWRHSCQHPCLRKAGWHERVLSGTPPPSRHAAACDGARRCRRSHRGVPRPLERQANPPGRPTRRRSGRAPRKRPMGPSPARAMLAAARRLYSATAAMRTNNSNMNARVRSAMELTLAESKGRRARLHGC